MASKTDGHAEGREASGRGGRKVWETFLRQPEDLGLLQDGAEVPLVIRDLTPGRRKYQMKHVVAALSRDSRAMAHLDELRARTVVGVLLPEVWGMRIIRELPVELPGTPYRPFFESLRCRGFPRTSRR